MGAIKRYVVKFSTRTYNLVELFKGDLVLWNETIMYIDSQNQVNRQNNKFQEVVCGRVLVFLSNYNLG